MEMLAPLRRAVGMYPGADAHGQSAAELLVVEREEQRRHHPGLLVLLELAGELAVGALLLEHQRQPGLVDDPVGRGDVDPHGRAFLHDHGRVEEENATLRVGQAHSAGERAAVLREYQLRERVKSINHAFGRPCNFLNAEKYKSFCRLSKPLN